jgi:hypothetical protein
MAKQRVERAFPGLRSITGVASRGRNETKIGRIVKIDKLHARLPATARASAQDVHPAA